MESWLNDTISWVAANPTWAGAVVLLVAFAESLAVVGVVLPGAFLMFGFGTLVGTGVLPFFETTLFAIAGAILGDWVSYWLGYSMHNRIRRWPPFKQHPEMIDNGHRFFEKYGSASIFIGRFIGPLRPIIPMVAGTMEMPPRKFLTFNVISALIWGPAYLLPGIVLGKSLESANALLLRWLIIVTVITLAIFIGKALWQKLGNPMIKRSAMIFLCLAPVAYGVAIFIAITPAGTLSNAPIANHQWKTLPQQNWKNWLQWLNPDASVAQAAIVSASHNGKSESIRAIKQHQGKSCLLRTWQDGHQTVAEIYRQDWGLMIITRERENPACLN